MREKRCLWWLLGALALILLLSPVWPQTANKHDWFPFYMPWDDSTQSPLHVSAFVDRPAGKHGFLQVKQSHLVFEDGTRGRFWGVNLVHRPLFMDHNRADRMVGRLAKLGVNMVRTLHMDVNWGAENLNLFAGGGRVQTRTLSPEMLDRFDYLVAQLKKQGIYVYLPLRVSREFHVADGVLDAEFLPTSGTVALFDQHLIELQQEYARQLLLHRNPYTGLRYIEDPVVALIELTNEASLLEGWAIGVLNTSVPGKRKNPLSMPQQGPIPPSYSRLLDQRWNALLLTRYKNRHDLASAWLQPGQMGLKEDEDPGSGSVARAPNRGQIQGWSNARWDDLTRFYAGLEEEYFRAMRQFLRGLGVKVPIIGTNYWLDPVTAGGGLPGLRSKGSMDVIDLHLYIPVSSLPLVKHGPRYPFNYVLAFSYALPDKPLTLSEFNHEYPSPYRAEAPMLVSAYASLHEVDAVLWYAYAHNTEDFGLRKHIDGHVQYDLINDISVMGQFPSAALAFLRGDIKPALKTLTVTHPEEEIYNDIRVNRGRLSLRTDGLPLELALIHKVRRLLGSPRKLSAKEYQYQPPKNPYVSDTGELVWDMERGLFTINTPRTQSAVGFTGQAPVSLAHLRLTTRNSGAAVTLISLEDAPISEASKMLLTAVARVENVTASGGRYLGSSAVLVEPVEGEAVVRLAPSTKDMEVWALDPRGARQKKVAVQKLATTQPADVQAFLIKLDKRAQTIFYELIASKE